MVCDCRQLGISELRYDSVEAIHPHSNTPIYITYNSGHGYPKYLITYDTCWSLRTSTGVVASCDMLYITHMALETSTFLLVRCVKLQPEV